MSARHRGVETVSTEYIIRELEMPNDVPKLLEMWKVSDDQWPGTWSGGVEMTEQYITEWIEREKALNVYVVGYGDKVVGYCSFHEDGRDKDVTYVGVLNVQPDHQKKSLARKMLNRCTERAVTLGYKQVSLHTWSGNLKSVPLYKKTGLYWVPDSSVYMRNFIPSILAMPCAKPYFSAHDWYQTFQRTLEQKEDDERWEGMKVFCYRWQEGDDMLTVWVDREARSLTAVETNDFFAGAIACNIEPAKGLATQIRWRVTNKGQAPLAVSLIANGTEHLKLEHRTAFTVAPGETSEFEAEVEVAADAPDVRERKPSPTVKTLLIVDSQVIELATGMHPREAVTVETDPHHITLYPGVAKTVHLQLRNYQEQDMEATISLAPPPGLEVDWSEQQITVPGKSWAGAPLTVRADAGGVYELQAVASFPGGRTATKRLPIFALSTGAVLGTVGKTQARIENEWTRLTIEKHGGWMSVNATASGEGLGGMLEFAGPPFWPNELEDSERAIALAHDEGRIQAQVTTELKSRPGLVLRRTVTLGAGPVAEVAHDWINNGTEPQSIQLQVWTDPYHRDGATITVPLADGIVHSRMSEFPVGEGEDISKKPEAFAERWVAVTSEHGTYGEIWESDVLENTVMGWGVEFLRPELTCAPHTWTPAGKLTIYAGPGDWRTVRTYAQRLRGTESVREPIPAARRTVCGARFEPAPLVTLDDEVTTKLVVDNLRAQPVTGSAALSTPAGLTADKSAFELKEVTRDKPFEAEVNLSLAAQAAAYTGSLALNTKLFDREISLHAVRLGTREAVQVAPEGDVWTIDNGRTCFAVTPGFAGTLSSWVEDGVDHLISPYPEVKTYGLMSPWHGGLTPLARHGNHEMPGKLGLETFTAKAVESPDAQGIPWTGVRLSSKMARDKLLGLAVELDYLTVGQSNVLKLVYRVRNETSAKRALGGGWLSFWQLDGTREHNTLTSAEIQRKPTPWEGWSDAGTWGINTNAQTGRTAILVSPYPRVRLIDWGDAGGQLGCIDQIEVPAMGVAERTCYIVLCENQEAARRYICLEKYV